ncbi:MAG: dihydrofolate synthase [Bacteroides sp. SM1_62]|nr:MAG: dihydrofolate synthase [Bacteroides sp. SM23_62]KPL24669.1 MAG: dihydrofolate synthase [Bacteroides sp. SM1_62]
MNYQDAITFLFDRLPMYQRLGKAAYKSSLDTTLALDEYFGHPHRMFKSIHIAGTNGKGSVAHMLSSILQSAGYRTGLYTSPHLLDFRERIRIDGRMIPEETVTGFVDQHGEILEKLRPSFFEMTVAMAFDFFAQEQVEVAVVETGMGGRLDSTNILRPMLSVITNIGFDHMPFLGDTIYKIASEKAGIIKNGIPLIVGETQEDAELVFTRQAREKGCPIVYADQEFQVAYSTLDLRGKQIMHVSSGNRKKTESLETDLRGLYQQKNVVTVLAIAKHLNRTGIKISEHAVRTGLAHASEMTGLRGRWEIIGYNPLTICDTAHNREGLREVMKQVLQTPWKKLHIILGLVDDKDPSKILVELPEKAQYYFTQSNVPRSMNREKLAAEGLRFGLYGQVCPTPLKALETALSKADPEDLILIGGSTFVVAEVLENLEDLPLNK